MKKKQIIAILIIIFAAALFAARHLPNPKPTVHAQHKFFGINISGPEWKEARYPDKYYDGYSYFKNRGLTIIRIPFAWEKIQPHPEYAFDRDELAKLTGMIHSTTKASAHVIIEPHNFGKYYNEQLTTHDISKFADLWGRLAAQFNDNPGIWGYELMNEPHGMPGGCADWKDLSQAAINAIRQKDRRHYILIPGYSWQSALDWQRQSSCLARLSDPQNKLVYTAHIYFDADKSGSYKSPCIDTNIGIKRSKPFLNWLALHNKTGMFTEYGIPPDPCWMETLDKFLEHIYDNPTIIGGIYWAAGPFWGNYKLSVEPKYGKDKPQMKILRKYPTKSR
jgi:endoglucanase